MTQKELISEFEEYLVINNYSHSTISTYKSKFRRYLESHDLDSKEELKNLFVQSPQVIKGLTAVYKWLNIQLPTIMTRKPKKYKKRTKKGYNVREDELVHKFQKERNIQNSTMHGYYTSLTTYINFCGFTCTDDMIQEALTDEKNRVPIKEARITEHLRAYKRHLQDMPNLTSNHSRHTYFTKIETFYRHFQVTVPQRPPMKIKKEYHVDYYDLPDKEMIETAINQSTIELRAIIYFMSSSGTAKAETLALTVETFLKGLKEYTTKTNPEEIVLELRGRKDLVPIISMTRIKTNVAYFTCCSSEATYHILEYMALAKRYKASDKLFHIRGSGLMKRFQQLNDDNNWGWVGPYRKFRTHMLRKFHASNLGCSFEVINTLEGRTNGVIHETYVKQKPDKLKEVYMEHMHNVMIHPENFEGPHCGSNTLNARIHNEVVKQLPSHASTESQEVMSVTDQSQIGGLIDYNMVKDIARLEARMDLLEKRLQDLGG